MSDRELTADYLRKNFKYDHETGLFFRVMNDGLKSAGSKTVGGYIVISILNRHWTGHRLAWLYVYGEWPTMKVDHINRVRHDNRISNLRQVSDRENVWNNGCTCFYEKNGTYTVRITANGKTISKTCKSKLEAEKTLSKIRLMRERMVGVDEIKAAIGVKARTGECVWYHKRSGKWSSCVIIDKKRFRLGSFNTRDEAVNAVKTFRHQKGLINEKGV